MRKPPPRQSEACAPLCRNLQIGALLVGLLLNGIASAQSAGSAIKKPTFAVASIRQNRTGDPPTSAFPLDRSDSFAPTGGLFSATNQPLIAYLIFAYKVQVSETHAGLMRSLPAWAREDRFDVQARAESYSPTKDELRLMMQSLLEDRFKLRVHRETQQVPVFSLLTVQAGRTGPLLKLHDPASACPGQSQAQPSSTPLADLLGRWPALCGDGEEIAAKAPYQVLDGGRDMDMASIASWLDGSADFDLPIVDRSGLNGLFDFVLQFRPEREGESLPDATAAAFNDALRDQLGLKLKKELGPARFFFVDHVAYPSPN